MTGVSAEGTVMVWVLWYLCWIYWILSLKNPVDIQFANIFGRVGILSAHYISYERHVGRTIIIDKCTICFPCWIMSC